MGKPEGYLRAWRKWILLATICLTVVVAGGCANRGAIDRVSLSELDIASDEWYSLRAADTGARLGASHVEVRSNETVLAIVERLSVQQGEDVLSYRTEVRYETGDGLKAHSALVTTYLNGTPYMGGRIRCAEGRLRAAAALADENGRLQEPVREADYEVPRNQTLIFLSGIPHVIRRMQKRDVLPEEMTVVEIPSDIDVLIKVLPDTNIQVESAGDTTRYGVRNAADGKPVLEWRVGEDGRVERGTFFGTRFVASSREEALRGEE